MLDIRKLRENPEGVIERLNTRGQDYGYLRELLGKDEERRRIISEVEELKRKRNESSKLIGELKKKKRGCDRNSKPSRNPRQQDLRTR